MRPLVSVIIPTYNCARFLPDAIESVLAQRYPRVEIIVVDDGSTDDTSEVLERYAHRIVALEGDNGGVARARNRGIAAASGELIAFLDADDVMLPGKLEAQSRVFDRREDRGMVHSGWTLIDERGRFLGERRPWVNAPRLDLRGWIMNKSVRPGALMVRRRWLEDVGGFDPAYGGRDSRYQVEDLELVLRLARSGCRAAWLRRPTFAYRKHDDSAMTRGALAQTTGVVRVLEDLYGSGTLPWSVRRLERAAFFYTHVWAAWYRHRHGYEDEAVASLEAAREWLPGPGESLVYRWAAQFGRLAAGEDAGADAVLDTLPVLRRASGVTGSEWGGIERAIRSWVEVQDRYLEGRYEEARAGLEASGVPGYERFFEIVLQWILVSASPVSGEAIARLWEDLRELAPPPAGRRHDETLLHLAGLGRHVRNRRGVPAIGALGRAIRVGWRPGAARVWGRFLRAGFEHYVLADPSSMGRLTP
ncbi:MAG: glycosyltransferase [Gemmatimonadota bacterium]|nr:glycosyltransferase [Gemmatimonadota bacterium]